ncbi:heme peroxidase [Schizopora paradoxa]|uniref:Peroxidase n=1 Tax=Schizopora paradoxa TaxID=27342 RepID=A0A0H2SDT0_9AGAM|nr:heme peroxidase [Schizopora paradoxa]
MGIARLIPLLSIVSLVSASSLKRVACPASNIECCVFFDLANTLKQTVFTDQCGTNAQSAIQLTFNDAIGFSMSGGPSEGTGADGSIIVFSETELQDPANSGVTDIIQTLTPLLQQFNISAGDLVQFAGAVGLSTCPGSPKLQFLAGRPNPTVPAALGLIPLSSDDVNTIFARLADAGFSPTELVQLLSAHSTAHVDSFTFDTTPTIFDTQFFLDVLLKGNATIPGARPSVAQAPEPSILAQEDVVRLQSDFAISQDSQTACIWQNMINNQQLMMNSFANAQFKLSITGQDQSQLIDCSEAVPTSTPFVGTSASFPPGTSVQDVQQACSSPFPKLE